jgi:alanyl-tRNA synthetase
MEIWNLVFTQFNKEEDGSYSKLKNTNIDTGMGLDRVAMVMQDVLSIFDVDTMKAVRDAVCAKVCSQYGDDKKKDISMRIITDHIRAVTFMVADGILPSNESRGYVLRRLLRRAVRHMKILGVNEPYLAEFASVVIGQYGTAYPELKEKEDYIRKLISVEEQRFYETLDAGMNVLKDMLSKTSNNTLNGAEAFKMYDTYGFPIELLEEIAAEQGMSVDTNGFKLEMEKQRKRGREGREASTYMGADETVYNKLDPSLTTMFLGYDHNLIDDALVKAIIIGNEIVEEAGEGSDVSLILDRTVLYAESGGQKGDIGGIATETGDIIVKDCIKSGNKFVHIGTVNKGCVKVGQTAHAMYLERDYVARNHSATHLLQKALREVLGSHVEQSGSLVSRERLRFDFTHFEAVTKEQLEQIESLVNEKIFEAIDIETKEMSVDDAKKIGAMALFGEKYGNTVRVVDIGGYSIELCGGTHLTNTSQIGSFKLLSESGISAGVRRIEGLTGHNVLTYYKDMEAKFKQDIAAYIQTVKKLEKELDKARSEAATNAASGLAGKKVLINGVSVVVTEVADADIPALRDMGDMLKSQFNPGVFVLAGVKDGKAAIVAMATEDAVKAGINCGTIIKEAAAVAGGSGGGKPNMAQAGAKDVDKLGESLKKAEEIIKGSL